MARVSDSLFIGFALNPEWDLMKPLHEDEIQIDLVLSRQFKQYPQLKTVADKLLSIVCAELCTPHILALETKLASLMPPPTHNLRVLVSDCSQASTSTHPAASIRAPTQGIDAAAPRTRPPRSQPAPLTQPLPLYPATPSPEVTLIPLYRLEIP